MDYAQVHLWMAHDTWTDVSMNIPDQQVFVYKIIEIVINIDRVKHNSTAHKALRYVILYFLKKTMWENNYIFIKN